MKISKQQLQELVKEEIQRSLNEENDLYSGTLKKDLEAYPSKVREALWFAYTNHLISYSSDAAVENKGRGFYVPAEKLVEFLLQVHKYLR